MPASSIFAGRFRPRTLDPHHAFQYAPAMDENERLREAYARRAERGADERYGLFDPSNLYLFQRRERALLRLLRERQLTPLGDKGILDVGCGNGALLAQFAGYGARPELRSGIDLPPDRISAARALHGGIDFREGRAGALPYADGAFDIALQFTVLSSVLDESTRGRIAAETVRVLRSGGTLIWYDFIWNPGNRDVRGIGLNGVRALYPGCTVDARRVTLAPPISRRLSRVSWTLCRLVEAAPFLRSHYLIAIRTSQR